MGGDGHAGWSFGTCKCLVVLHEGWDSDILSALGCAVCGAEPVSRRPGGNENNLPCALLSAGVRVGGVLLTLCFGGVVLLFVSDVVGSILDRSLEDDQGGLSSVALSLRWWGRNPIQMWGYSVIMTITCPRR